MSAGSASRRRAAYRRGYLAEYAALAFLLAKGYRPLARRCGGKGGEIDLIVMRGRTIAFVEVKARADLDIAARSVSAQKRRLMERLVRAWLARNPWAMDHTLRLDAMFIAPRRWPRHVAGAYDFGA